MGFQNAQGASRRGGGGRAAPAGDYQFLAIDSEHRGEGGEGEDRGRRLLTYRQLQKLMAFVIAVVYFTAGYCVPAATITHERVSPSPLPSLLFEFLLDYGC